MKLHQLRESPPADLANQLDEFESGFSYPLGPGRSFRISHSPDYTRFFRSMGSARCFVAERADRVIGALSIAIRQLTLPNGDVHQTAYVSDLKIHIEFRNTMALVQLARVADAWARPQVTAAFGVVMDGTGAAPTNYSGRLGIELFSPVGKVIVLRLPTSRTSSDEVRTITSDDAADCFALLAHGRYFASGGSFADRSEILPRWLIDPDGHACGRLEDTRKAKRLIGNDGIEMVSAHLCCFAFSNAIAGANLIHAAREQAGQLKMPALFVSVSEADFPALNQALGDIDKVIAPATIYGAGLAPGQNWIINTSEI